jgi:hypothetical protein
MVLVIGTSVYSCAVGSMFLPPTPPPSYPHSSSARHPPSPPLAFTIRHLPFAICHLPSVIWRPERGQEVFGGTCWTRDAQFPGLPVPFRAGLGRPIQSGPSVSARRLPAWPALRCPVLEHSELGSLCMRDMLRNATFAGFFENLENQGFRRKLLNNREMWLSISERSFHVNWTQPHNVKGVAP